MAPPLMNRAIASLALLSCGLLAAAEARADIAPPERTVCYGKKIGEACSFGTKGHGTCSVHRCTRRTATFDCVLCEEETVDDAGIKQSHVEPQGPIPPPLFDASPVASPLAVTASPAQPSATLSAANPREAARPPPPATAAGCGRCNAGAPGTSHSSLALAATAAALALIVCRGLHPARSLGRGRLRHAGLTAAAWRQRMASRCCGRVRPSRQEEE
jgi:hypothetical protein